ncbi:MAG: phospholipase [Deltaproteobacteria bacterium]|nr:phospholipase [Deltaproteobacteria bacterium]
MVSLLLGGCAVPIPISKEKIESFLRHSERTPASVTFSYLLYEPIGFNKSTGAGQVWPAILFLHGLFESGDDIGIVTRRGLPRQLELGLEIPFIVISPQTPTGTWDIKLLDALIDHVLDRYPIDPRRLYVTGISLGGHASWELAATYPDRFAAIAPVSTWGDVKKAVRVKDIPIWAFHGSRDPLIWPSRHKRMIEEVRTAGGHPKWTLVPGGSHDIGNQVYGNPKLYEWFLQHRVKP